jgi:hypothetical protein
MKPKLVIRNVITIIVASIIIFFLESYRQGHKTHYESKIIITQTEFKVGNNDFILFESVSKFLFINLSK